jgi:2-keto-3-deoxy-L-rhamnonate aldolase RhmA
MSDARNTADEPRVINPLADRLAAGELGLCMMLQQCRSVEIAIAARRCGYDAINIDLEHSTIGIETASQIAVACLLAGVTPLVRVPDADSPDLVRMIDAGCLGVIVPNVEDAGQAGRVARACRFAPRGHRAVTANWPQIGYRAFPAEKIRAALDASMTVVAMIESPLGVANCEEIAATDGIDIVQLGCNDFCASIGVPGQLRDARVEEAMDRILAACARHGKVAGVGGLRTAPDLSAHFIRKGVRYIAAGNEWNFMMNAASQAAAELRGVNLLA